MEFFHVFNRGVEKRDVVRDDGDRIRFVHSLYVFNDLNATPNSITQNKERENLQRDREPLVKLHAWCLMNNHYHLLVSPEQDDLTNLSLFMKKLNGGYAKFFNTKYERSGYLWQGKFKKVHVTRDAYFGHVPYYIHLNPLDNCLKEWRERKVANLREAIHTLDEFRWSSWLDYTGVNNFPSVLYRKALTPVLGSKQSQVRAIRNIVTTDAFLNYGKDFEI